MDNADADCIKAGFSRLSCWLGRAEGWMCADGFSFRASADDSLILNCGEEPVGLGTYGLPVGTEGKRDGFFSLSRFRLAISAFRIRSRRCW